MAKTILCTKIAMKKHVFNKHLITSMEQKQEKYVI